VIKLRSSAAAFQKNPLFYTAPEQQGWIPETRLNNCIAASITGAQFQRSRALRISGFWASIRS
jgi:hypothetical protein